MVCTARKTQFYIPGETNLSERLRKRAFDSGTFTLLTYLFNQLKDVQENPFKAIREHIQQQILNYETMTDLAYHAKLLTYLRDNPHLAQSESVMRLNIDSAMEETKELSQSALEATDAAENGLPLMVAAKSHEVGSNLASPKAKNAHERQSSSKHLSSLAGNYQTSPRLSTSKGRSVKKYNSSMMNFASQSHATATLGQIVANAQATPSNQDKLRQLYEVDTEKLLMSNDKVTITDLWKSNPQPMFPSFFYKVLDLDEAITEANAKTENLKSKIDKRKFDE